MHWILLQVNFLKEGCGTDNVCQSNLQLTYKFCYRETNHDVFPLLPTEYEQAISVQIHSVKSLEKVEKVNRRKWHWFIFVVFCSENGLPVISLSDQKDIAVEVTVKNMNGDDAHEAKLVGMFPNALSYSGFRSQKTTVWKWSHWSDTQSITLTMNLSINQSNNNIALVFCFPEGKNSALFSQSEWFPIGVWTGESI